MEIVLGIEKKMSNEGYKSNISRIAGSGEACRVSPTAKLRFMKWLKDESGTKRISEMCSLSRGRRSQITGLFETSLGSYEPRKKISRFRE